MAKFKAAVLIPAIVVGIVLALITARRLAGNAQWPALVPLPVHVVPHKGQFRITRSTRILVDGTAVSTGKMLANRLRAATGFQFPMESRARKIGENGTILLSGDRARKDLGLEGYSLEVNGEEVTIRAFAPAGLFFGSQTLLQLLPPRVFSSQASPEFQWTIPGVQIEDAPRFKWRGAMLDVSRHFFNGAEVKEFIDSLALHKLNTFHWHLTDDQGWRLEIKKYPRLTEVGAWRKRIGFNLDPKSSSAYGPDGRYGGYYTQEQVRDIIAYAGERHITIVPEIDMPGHSSAALAAYPQFSCSGGPYSTDMAEDVWAGVYCAGKDETFEFVEEVLSEVMDLFPGAFIHIGGDEVPTQNWHHCPRCQARMRQEGIKSERELESYFVQRVEKFINAHGRRAIGWSEIRNDNLAPSTVVMDWIGGGAEAARGGHDVVMSPEEFCYLDFYQSRDRSREPPAAGAYLPLSKAYSFEPIPGGLAKAADAHVLGGQGNIWTEYMPSMSQVEYMAYPRLSALSEVFWSPRAARDPEDFRRRLRVHEERLQQLGMHYRRDPNPP